MAKLRMTAAQTKLMAWAASSAGQAIVCPNDGDSGRAAQLSGRDGLGRYTVRYGFTTAQSLVAKGLLFPVPGERGVYSVVAIDG